MDSRAYGRLEIVPLNIIKYNIFSTSGGPELYGTEPWSFYIFNGLLGFNILLPLALYSIPTLFVTAVYDPKRVGDQRDRIPGQTSPFVSLAIRLSPLYLWLGVLTLQPHKEERFLFPAYGLVLLNASTTIYLLRGWFEQAFISYTKSPYKVRFFLSLAKGRSLISSLRRRPKPPSSATLPAQSSPPPPSSPSSVSCPSSPTTTPLSPFTSTSNPLNSPD